MKKRYFIGLFIIIVTVLCTTITFVKADEQINNSEGLSSLEKVKPQIDFQSLSNGYLIGDTAITCLTAIRPNVTNINFNKLNFIVNSVPSNLQLVGENAAPNIDVQIQSASPNPSSNGQEINVTYQINPEPFNFNLEDQEGISKSIREAVFIVDTSNNMSNNGFSNAIVNGLTKEITNSNEIQKRQFRMSILGYNDTIAYPNNDYSTARLYSMSDGNDRDAFRRLVQEGKLSLEPQKSGRNIIEAIKHADKLLSNSNNVGKAIVLIGTDNITIDQSTIDLIKSKGYKIISFLLPTYEEISSGSYSLKDLHQALGANNNDYFETTYDSGNYNAASGDMSKVRDSLLADVATSVPTSYSIPSPTLNFDLGNDFLAASSELVEIEGTKYQLEISKITYKLTTQNDDGTYRYEAPSFEVNFKIRVKTEKVGKITFANTDNVDVTNITYTDFKGKEVKNLIETPVIEVIEAPNISPIVKNSINILEIQPADSFTLTGSSDSGKIKTGTESCTINIDDVEYEVNITHMSMPEFIGKAEKIDGKYDIIVLGRYVDSSITSSNNELNQYRYRDYYYDRGDNNEENDITVRKANELIEFMNKNQLVYIDSNIINNTTNSNSDYMKTNLYKIFSTDQNRSQKNVKTNFTTSKESGDNVVTLQQVIKDYISLDPKEKGFTISLIDPVPNDITTDDINTVDGKAENRNRYLDLTVRNADNSKENVTLNLYLDLNGDGLYNEDEIAVSRDHLALPLQNYRLDFSIHPDFIGLLEWKLEVVREDTNQTTTYLTGSNFFHRLTEEKKKINVLQITAQSNYATVDGEGNTDEDTNYQVLNLKSNDDFTNLLSTVELKDYDITIDIIYYEQYIKYLKSSDDELDESKLKFKYLNGYYDMVICGFQDVYGRNAFGGDNNDKDKSKYLDSLKFVDSLIEFVRTGQGLMLTHDTIEKNDTPSMFNTFRVFTGQSRYPTLSNGEIVNDFNGATISYDLNIRGNNTNGFTIWGLMGDSEGATNSMSTGVYRTNNALITSYPYVLSDEEEEGLLRIRRTHGQYYQLNLEDEEVIPWYSFSANNKGENGGRRPQFNTWINSVNPYDVRNNYYTYSKGNITFSGTGEQRREYIHYPKSELKLFVNTIIKAERGANHRPTVEVQNIEGGQQISLSQNKIEFNVIPRDIDLDLMDVTVEVSACKNNKCSVVGTPIVYEDRKDNESFQVTLNQDFLSQVEKDANQLKIKVYAVDEHQAKSEEVIKTLEIVDLDLLTVSLYPQDGNTRFLVGDTISLVADFSKSENYKNDYIELNYNLNSIPSYLTLSGESSRNLGTLTSESIQTVYELTVQADSAFSTSTISSTKVGGESRYCINSCSTVIAGTQSSPLEIKKGQIRIKLISEQFSEQLSQVSLKIENQSGGMWTVTPNSAGEFIVDNVPTGSYSLTVELPDGLKTFEVIQQNGDEGQVVDLTTPLQFDINFENNLFEANFTFIEPQTDINHGLYGGLDESNNQFEIIPSEITQSGEDLRKEFVGGSIVNFAGTFTYKSPLQSIQLLVDKKLNVSKENIKAYEILTIESGLELKEIENVDIYVARQKSEDLIMFNFINRISANTPVLIHYSVTVPDINDGIYTNTLKVGTKEKLTSIKSIKQIDENSSENLPYLF